MSQVRELTWLEDTRGHTASWAEETVKARCLLMEWQVPEAVKKHPRVEEVAVPQERKLDSKRGFNSLDVAPWTVKP